MAKKVFPSSPSDVKETKIDPINRNEANIDETVIDLSDLIRRQDNEIKTASANRATFIQNQDKWYRQRYGITKRALFPWYNASSQHLPMQDMTVRKFKPEYVGVAHNTFPQCELTVSPSEIAAQIQNDIMAENASYHFDWLLRIRMDVFDSYVLMVDKMLSKGFSIVKVIYDKVTEPKVITIYRDELEAKLIKDLINPTDIDIISNPAKIQVLMGMLSRVYGFDLEDKSDLMKAQNICAEIYKGTAIIEFTVQETRYDAPKWVVLDPKDILVPDDTESIFDLERARWICHQYYVTPSEALNNARIGKWDKEEVTRQLEKVGIYNDDLVDSKYKYGGRVPEQTLDKSQKQGREGITTSHTEKNILIKEVCLWFDSDNDGIEERHILEYADGSDVELRFIRYPYDMRMWPYVKVIFELADTGHYSNRGTVEIEESVATAINTQHRMKINRQIISSTPTLLYAANKVNPNNFQYIPGEPMPVVPPLNENVKWFMPQNTDATFINEEGILKNWDAELMAANDWGSPMPNQSGTAKEYIGNQGNRIGIRQLDIQIFQKSLKEIYKRTFSLWIQFSSNSKFPFIDSDGTTKFIDKASLMRDYQFQPMGSFGTSNPQLSAQVSQRMYETFINDPMINQYELKRDFITKQGDQKTCKRLLKTKQQIAAEQQQQMVMAQQAHQQQIAEEIQLAQVGVKVGDFKPVQPTPEPQKQQIGGNAKIGG